MTNEQVLYPIFKKLYDKIENKDFVIDKQGVKTVEIIAINIELNPTQKILDFKVRKTNEEYAKRELQWYDSQSLYVKDIPGKVPKIWQDVAGEDGKINSNYGYLIYSKENYSQYLRCIDALINDKNTRQAIMLYNRPSIHLEWNENGKHDFVCCIANHFFIRNNKLISVVLFRSQDIIFGFMNDFYFKCVVYERLFRNLKLYYDNLEIGEMIWISDSLHCYERHFNLIKQIVENE